MSLDDVALVAIFNMIVSSSTLPSDVMQEHWWLKKGTGRSLADWG